MRPIPIRSIRPSHPAAIPGTDLHVRSLRDVLRGEKREESLHRHAFYFLLVVKRGSGTHEIDFVPHSVVDHTVFFVRPGQAHRLSLDASCTGYLVEFSADLIRRLQGLPKELLRRAGRLGVLHPDAEHFDKICGSIRAMMHEQGHVSVGGKEAIEAHVTLLLIELARQDVTQGVDHTEQSAYAVERFDELVELIEQHLAEYKLASDYARMMNMSLYQVNALTRSLVGSTCSDLINSLIITEAKRYLLATTDQVKEIAYHLGYEDPSYFNRYFKKHTGVSPEVFRRNQR
jgi:AraC family transcriptional activator of pobA